MRLLAAGRDCDVFDLGDGTVLRRQREGRDQSREAGVLRHARAHGVPCPAVHRAEGPDLVMELVSGPTLLDEVAGGRVDGAAAGAVLAGLHRRLDDVPGLQSASLLHMDVHPLNVLLSPDGPVLLDWTNATDGPRGLDVAMTWVILTPYVELSPEVQPMIDALLDGTDRADAAVHLGAAVRRRLADANLTDGERDAVEALSASS